MNKIQEALAAIEAEIQTRPPTTQRDRDTITCLVIARNLLSPLVDSEPAQADLALEDQEDEDWRLEMAREAGMLHGVEAYNEALGQSTAGPVEHHHGCPDDCSCWGDEPND